MKKLINKKTILSKEDGVLYISDNPKYDYLFKPETRLFTKMNNK